MDYIRRLRRGTRRVACRSLQLGGERGTCILRELARNEDDPKRTYFEDFRPFVRIAPRSNVPVFYPTNHAPAIVNCLNGNLLAVWYTSRQGHGREVALAASRLRYGQKEWEPASPFLDAPGRNDSNTVLWADDRGTLFHFYGLSAAATWGNMATVLRISKDSGATWSKARLIMPEHGERRAPQEAAFRTPRRDDRCRVQRGGGRVLGE